MKQTYTVDFICRFDLVMYPFDRQSCQMFFQPREEGIDLTISERAHYAAKDMELNEYLLSEVKEANRSLYRDVGTEVLVEFQLSRRMTSVVMTTFVPTALICMLCHSSVYYGGMLFKAVVAVNLTSLLCLVTMFNR